MGDGDRRKQKTRRGPGRGAERGRGNSNSSSRRIEPKKTWHRGMQLYNAAGPPPTPISYYYSAYIWAPGRGPDRRMRTRTIRPGPPDFSSSIALQSITARTWFNAGLNERLCGRLNIWICGFMNHGRSWCRCRSIFNLMNAIVLLFSEVKSTTKCFSTRYLIYRALTSDLQEFITAFFLPGDFE